MIPRNTRFGLVLGTILQLAMVAAGHFSAATAAWFGPVGLSISLIAGLAYAALAGRGVLGERLLGGFIVGAGCALIGVAASWLLGDVPAVVLVFGTAGSAVTGTIGAAIGRLMAR